MTTPTTSIPRSITFDRATKDFRAEADGNVIGFFPSYLRAEEACDDYVADLLERGLIGESDAGSFCTSCGDTLVGDGPLCAACIETSEADPDAGYLKAHSEYALVIDVCRNCGSTHKVAPVGQIVCLVCGQPWRVAVNESSGPNGIALDIENPRELFYRLWHDEGYTTKAPPGATCTVEVCATCQCLLLHYPFSKPGSYRLFAYCETCDMATEV